MGYAIVYSAYPHILRLKGITYPAITIECDSVNVLCPGNAEVLGTPTLIVSIESDVKLGLVVLISAETF